jgi:hypothetical protein
MVKELRTTYDNIRLLIKATNVGGIFDNDFEMYEQTENGGYGRLLMTYKERWGKEGYRVEVFSEGILKKEYIKGMLRMLLPLVELLPNAQLIIQE